jgi:hypothetical protein
MAITKCRISAQTVNRFTVTARALRQRGRTPGDWMVRAGLMEEIMSKTNDSSYDVAATSERELTEAELDLVAGGAPTHYEFGASYGINDLACDFWLSFAGSPWMGTCHP